MFFSRRDLLSSLAAVTVSPILPAGTTRADAESSPASVRLPLQEFIKSPTLVDALRRGVQAMRSRPPSDPRSWFFQGAIHAVNDQLLADALLVDPAVGLVDQAKFWNTCPHAGQNSANFVIWHRAYLYYFERILRDAAQEPALALPYWDYGNPNSQSITPNPRLFPELFAPQFLDASNTRPNPLFHRSREAAFTSGRFELSALAVDSSAATAAPTFFGVTETQGFAGGFSDNDPGTQGIVERRPHNQIHFAVGGVIGDAAGAMADVPTAAFDPIFWVHHSNIDRLWARWACTPGKTWGPLPDRSWFEERPWFFHDFDLAVRNETREFYLDHKVLGIGYFDDETSCQPLSLPTAAELRSTVAPVISTGVQDVLHRVEVGLEASAIEEASYVIEEPSVAAISQRLRESPATALSSRRRIMLELGGIDYDLPPSAGFDLYVNLPPGREPDRSDPSFVATIALFGLKQQHGSMHAGGSQRFDITGLFPTSSEALTAPLIVRVVPFDLLTPLGNNRPIRRSDPIRIREIKIVII